MADEKMDPRSEAAEDAARWARAFVTARYHKDQAAFTALIDEFNETKYVEQPYKLAALSAVAMIAVNELTTALRVHEGSNSVASDVLATLCALMVDNGVTI